jgi:acetyl esterase/lipase
MSMRRSRAILCGVLLVGTVWVTGCGDDDAGNSNANLNNQNQNSIELDPITPGGCGLPAYEWLPTAGMGEVISFEEDVLSPMSAAGVDVFLGALAESLVPAPYGVRIFRIRYTTQDKGQAVEATGLVAIPWNEDDPPAELPVALWLHGTTGFEPECAPSAMGVEGTGFLLLYAAHGYVTAAPDFIGLDGDEDAPVPPDVKHFYVGLEQAGIGSLDALRASYRLVNEELGLKVTASQDVVIWGASQGGHAAFATNLLAPYYAPEFNYRALVAMVPVTDLVGLSTYSLSEFRLATRSIASFWVTAHTWYEGAEPWTDVLTDDDPTYFATDWPAEVFTDCDAMDVLRDATDVAGVFDASWLAQGLGEPDASWDPWYCYLADNSITTARIPLYQDIPTLFILGENDDLVYTPVERDDFDRMCAMGYRMEYLECAGAGHTDAAIWSLVDQHAWVRDRLDNIPLDPATECQLSPPVHCSGEPANP